MHGSALSKKLKTINMPLLWSEELEHLFPQILRKTLWKSDASVYKVVTRGHLEHFAHISGEGIIPFTSTP
jgi:hypothetical protein